MNMDRKIRTAISGAKYNTNERRCGIVSFTATQTMQNKEMKQKPLKNKTELSTSYIVKP